MERKLHLNRAESIGTGRIYGVLFVRCMSELTLNVTFLLVANAKHFLEPKLVRGLEQACLNGQANPSLVLHCCLVF